MEKLKKYREELVWAIVLAIVSLIYFLRYWNRMIPYIDGWGLFYSDLIADGKMPYRDFYYYLPPLNLLVDFVLWKLSFGYILVYRAWRLVERICIVLLLYHLLCKITKPKYAGFAAFLGIILSAATVFDLVGDYNQTCDLIVLLLCWVLSKYVNAFQAGCTKKEYRCLFACGLIIGLSFLIKQTIFVSEVIICFLVLTIIFYIKKKGNYIYSVLFTAAGALLPIGVCCFFLAWKSALIPYIEQVYLKVGSKGSIIDILLSPLRQINIEYIFIVAMVSGIALFLYKLNRDQISFKKKVLGAVVAYGYLLGTVLALYGDSIQNIFRVMFFPKIVLAAVAVSSFFLAATFKNKVILGERLQVILYFCMFSLFSMYVFYNKEYAQNVYITTNAFSLLEKLGPIISLAGILLLFYFIYQFSKTKSEKDFLWICLLSGGMISSYASMMACGVGSINNRAIIILFPVIIVFLLEKVMCLNQLKQYLLFSFGMIICIIGMSQKIANAYSWWGWSNEVICEENNYGINIRGLRGFRVSENTKRMYEEMYRVIDENTDTDSVIYGFPHIRIFNVLLGNSNMSSFVPVPFYDVCADDYAKQEAVLLQECSPDIVIWCDIPFCLETHETVFRNGELLGQRDIQVWLSKAVAKGEYDLIGQYDAIYIYKKVGGDNIGYTYYKRGGHPNSTLYTAEGLDMLSDFFDGDGSEESPYLIQNEKEFEQFRNLVNGGCCLADVYFLQTNDLDFSKYEPTMAIGGCEIGTHFDGTYDGDGYAISGLTIEENTDTGLFGMLGGTVQNVKLQNSTISGTCCAGIAAHAISDKARVINCVVEDSVKVMGSFRAGGIVDDFSGGIINCISDADVFSDTDTVGKLYSYAVGYMVNCIEE